VWVKLLDARDIEIVIALPMLALVADTDDVLGIVSNVPELLPLMVPTQLLLNVILNT